MILARVTFFLLGKRRSPKGGGDPDRAVQKKGGLIQRKGGPERRRSPKGGNHTEKVTRGGCELEEKNDTAERGSSRESHLGGMVTLKE